MKKNTNKMWLKKERLQKEACERRHNFFKKDKNDQYALE